MKKFTMSLAATSMAVLMAVSMSGCTVTETVTTEKAEETTEAFVSVKEVSEQEMIETTGIDLPTPEGATNAVYSVVVEGELTMSQLSFTLDGKDMYLRAIETGETTFEDDTEDEDDGDADSISDEIDEMTMTLRKGDISGLDYDWNLDATETVQGREANVHVSTDGAGYIAWIDPVPGVLYNLCMKSGATTDNLVAYAEQVFVPVQGEADGDADAETTDINTDFNNLLQAIYDTKAGSAGSSLRAEEAAKSLLQFVNTYAGDITAQNMEALASEKLNAMKDEFGEDFKSNFQECLDEVVETAKSQDSSCETDTAFNQVVNGIQTNLDNMK